jgi:hypothetical protein
MGIAYEKEQKIKKCEGAISGVGEKLFTRKRPSL